MNAMTERITAFGNEYLAFDDQKRKQAIIDEMIAFCAMYMTEDMDWAKMDGRQFATLMAAVLISLTEEDPALLL